LSLLHVRLLGRGLVGLALGGLLLCRLVLLGRLGPGGTGLGLASVGRRPECQVVAEQLHDERRVAVRLLGQRVELGNGVVEGLLGEVASTVWRVEDLVVEDGEVEGETQADGVRRCQLRLGDVGCALRFRE
jgi:hypothetical protein